MNVFEQLRLHAQRQPDVLALASPRHRLATYRKLWSRIERATARLQAEWHIETGDTVIYHGQAHPDAVILYFSLARSGARLLPLEMPDLQRHAGDFIEEFKVRTLVYEMLAPDALENAPCRFHHLQDLLRERCPHEPLAIHEAEALPGTIGLQPLPNGRFQPRIQALEAKMLALLPDPQTVHVPAVLFGETDFAKQVLPTLMAGGTLIFA